MLSLSRYRARPYCSFCIPTPICVTSMCGRALRCTNTPVRPRSPSSDHIQPKLGQYFSIPVHEALRIRRNIMATAIAPFLPAEIWQNILDLLGSWDRLSDMTHAWTTLRLVNSTFKKDVEARFKQLFNQEQVRIRITGGMADALIFSFPNTS